MNTIERKGIMNFPLAFHIRKLRQWYGRTELSQTTLAALAGIAPSTLRLYEHSRELPPTLAAFLSLSAALEVPLEALLDPRQVDRLRAAVAERRAQLVGESARTPASSGSAPLVLAACYRSPYLALAVVGAGNIIQVTSHFLRKSRRRRPTFRALIASAAADYGVTALVVEPRYSALHTAAAQLGVPLITQTMGQAKQLLLNGESSAAHDGLYQQLTTSYPQLQRLARFFLNKGKTKIKDEPWRTVQLLAVALGLAGVSVARSAGSPDHQAPHSYF